MTKYLSLTNIVNIVNIKAIQYHKKTIQAHRAQVDMTNLVNSSPMINLKS